MIWAELSPSLPSVPHNLLGFIPYLPTCPPKMVGFNAILSSYTHYSLIKYLLLYCSIYIYVYNCIHIQKPHAVPHRFLFDPWTSLQGFQFIGMLHLQLGLQKAVEVVEHRQALIQNLHLMDDDGYRVCLETRQENGDWCGLIPPIIYHMCMDVTSIVWGYKYVLSINCSYQ